MKNINEKIKEAEALGIIGDSQEVRLKLMEKVTNGILTLESMQKELKKIQDKSKAEGLIIRSELSKYKIIDYDLVEKRKIYLLHKKLNESLEVDKQTNKKIKI